MKIKSTFLLSVFSYFLLLATTGNAQKSLSIGVIADCPNTQSQAFVQNILREAKTLMPSTRFDLKVENILHSDCDMSRTKRNLDQLLSDTSIDIILGVDALGSHTITKNGPYEKPVIAAIVLNVDVQKTPITRKGTSGVKNLAYLEMPFSPMRDIEVFQSMIGFEKLAVIIDSTTSTGIPEIKEFLDKGIDALGARHEFIYTTSTASNTLAKIDESFDAVYLFPSEKMSVAEDQRLIDGVNARGLKSCSILGRMDVDRGVLAGVAPVSNLELMARRIALNIQRISSGEDPADLNVKLLHQEKFVINMATARQIDYSPNWETLSEAILINEERDDIERSISIFTAIEEGLGENLNIEIAKREVEIVAEDVNIAKSVLLPDIGASASHVTVDNATANVSNGQNPENRGSGSLQLSQIVYSEQAAANKSIQQYLLQAQKEALSAQSLDIILDVSTTYLNLMQAKTAESIQKQNLEVTRKNLELARVSASLGETGPSDLYRWQGEIATAKSNLIRATAQKRLAEMALNQVLNRPIDELFLTQEVDLTDSRLLINNETTDQYVNNPKQFYRFADFMVERAKANTPDLKQFQYNVSAQERAVLLNKRNIYVPAVSLGAGYNYEFYRNGAGTDFPAGFGTPNDWNWNLQLGASIPIFQGGGRNARIQQSKVQLGQLNTQKLNTERLIEQQVRSELENIRASFTNINLTRDAEEAVVKNFELIQDSYSKGLVTITQLLDAQNAAISGQLNSANAVFIFLIDLLSMERATGNYYMLMAADQKQAFSEALTTYFNN